jgi:hypothetical protein
MNFPYVEELDLSDGSCYQGLLGPATVALCDRIERMVTVCHYEEPRFGDVA